MDTDKLRQKILDLAIHGKLVPQDPNDEPASELLKRIHAERERLVKEGKLKKDKNNTSDKSHYEKVPFEIPKSWVWITLGEIGSWQSGSTPSRARKDYYGGNIPWLRTGDLNDNYVSNIPCKITDKAREELSLRINPEGSVLLAMYGATIGKVGILKIPATTNQACCACTNFVCINNEYLFYFLLASKQSFIQKGTGGAQPNISKEIIVSTSIPLPSLSEQRRIVLKLKYYLKILDNICNNLNDISFITKHIRSKILDLALNGLLTEQDSHDEPAIELLKKINPNFKPCDNSHYKKIPVNWELCYLQDVCKIERGITFPASAKSLSHDKNMIPCIRTANVQDRLDLSNLWYIDKRYINGNVDKLVEKNDIILSSANSRELVGKTSYVYKDEGDITFGGFVLKIRSRGIDPMYLFFFLRYTYLSNIFKDIASQTTNIANISTLSLSNLVMAVPPLEEQKRISQTVKRIFIPLEKCVFEINN